MDSEHKEITPTELAAMIERGEAVVIDVREPDEFAEGHIPSARNMPLSAFDPAALPHEEGKHLILNCAGGRRSGMALDQCSTAQSHVDTHLAGGIGAWEKSGLPIEK